MNCRIPSALVLGAFLLAIPCGAVPPAAKKPAASPATAPATSRPLVKPGAAPTEPPWPVGKVTEAIAVEKDNVFKEQQSGPTHAYELGVILSKLSLDIASRQKVDTTQAALAAKPDVQKYKRAQADMVKFAAKYCTLQGHRTGGDVLPDGPEVRVAIRTPG